MLAGMILVIVAWPTLGSQPEPSHSADRLPTIGTIATDPIKITVWTNRPSGETFKAGDRVIIYFKADRQCYVTVVNISKAGDVAILFPNRESPHNLVQADEQYTLFGEKSNARLLMGKGLSEAKTVFYASSKPVPLDPLKIPTNQLVIRIPHSSESELELLAERIGEVAVEPGYNRVLLKVRGDSDETQDLRLMGKHLPERVPSKSESDPPETITGAQGVKPRPDR